MTHRSSTVRRAAGAARPLAICLLLVLVLAGCGKTSFLGRQFDDFTAYYNTFYNAREAFEAGVTALEKQDQPINRDLYLPLFTNPAQASSGQRFDDAIKKSADVLRSHPRSRWVDDALLLIGKSYFYQQNYVGAEQKFQEVINLGTGLQDEARFWLARTLIASGSFDEATEHLTLTLAREGLSPRWEPRLRLALGELYVKRRDWEEAARELAAGLAGVHDRDLGARAQFLLGQVLETLERHDEAVEAFRSVQRYNPLYELSYAAQYNAIRVQGLHVDADAALDALRRMERDDKHYSSRYELAFLRARILQAHHRPDDALALYDEILYDAEGNVAALRGRVHYALGELFRDEYDDFVLAAAYFDTARTALRVGTSAQPTSGGSGGSAVEVLYTPAAITDAEKQAEMFRSFAEVFEEVVRMDSLLYLGSLDDEAFAEKMLDIRRQRARELAEEQRLREQQQAMERFQSGATAATQNTRNSGAAAGQAGGTSGFLFHRDPMRVAEARMSFVDRWGDRPLVPNWRRIDAVRSATTDDATVAVQPGTAAPAGAVARAGENALPMVDFSAVPRDSLQQAKMRAERAMARYELANVLFLSMSRPDSAAAWYRRVIDEDIDQPVAQRAFYALAEVQRALGDTVSARRLYEQVLEAYPDSDFADRVREQLGLPVKTVVVSDTLALAEEAYRHAFGRWRRGFLSDALNKMVDVAVRYPKTDVAARSLLAAGAIFAEWAESDSLDMFGPLPVNLPDSLLAASPLFGRTPAGTDSTASALPASPAHTADGQPQPVVDEKPQLADGKPQADADSRPNPRRRAVADSLAAVRAVAGADSLDTAVPDPAVAPRPDRRVALQGDSLAVPTGDSLATNATPDSLTLAADSLTLVPDSLTLATDSLAVGEGEGPGGQIASAEPDRLNLEMLYASIQRHFPSTPYAKRAGALLKVLEERRPAPAAPADSVSADSVLVPADSLGTVRSDSLAAAVLAEADSAVVAPDSVTGVASALRPDSLGAAEKRPRVVAEPDAGSGMEAPGQKPSEEAADSEASSGARRLVLDEETPLTRGRPGNTPPSGEREGAGDRTPASSNLRSPERDPEFYGQQPIDPSAGGWTILVATVPDRGTAEQMVQGLRYQGLRSHLYTERVGDGDRHRVIVGHFKTEADARRRIKEHGSWLPPGIDAYELRPVD